MTRSPGPEGQPDAADQARAVAALVNVLSSGAPVTVKLTGGFAGIPTTWTLDPSALPGDLQTDYQALVAALIPEEQSGVSSTSTASATSAHDAFDVEISGTGASWSANELALPPAARDLAEFVKENGNKTVGY